MDDGGSPPAKGDDNFQHGPETVAWLLWLTAAVIMAGVLLIGALAMAGG